MTRLSILMVISWWRRRCALRKAPSLTEIETRRAHLARLAKHHRERTAYAKALRDAVNRRMAAELGRQAPALRRTQ